jgi:hypothetical protein
VEIFSNYFAAVNATQPQQFCPPALRFCSNAEQFRGHEVNSQRVFAFCDLRRTLKACSSVFYFLLD